ncbi:uncharacterized protein FYW23_008802 isoform 2-T3 [Sylvia borin]
MNNRRAAHAAQEPHGHRQQTQGKHIPQERTRSPYFLSGKSSRKLSVSKGEALAFQHGRGPAVGVRKRGGARRGRGMFPALQQHGRRWRRARSGCASRTDCGPERHGALPGAPGRARPCPQPGAPPGRPRPHGEGPGHRPAAPKLRRERPGRALPPAEGARQPQTPRGRPAPTRAPALRRKAASPAGPGSLPTRGPLRSHPPPLAPAPRQQGPAEPGAQKFLSTRGTTLPGQSWAGMVAAALAALGPAALSRPAEEMGSSGASPPGPAALPGTARRAAPAPRRRRPPADIFTLLRAAAFMKSLVFIQITLVTGLQV